MAEGEIFSDSFFAMGTRCDLVFAEVERTLAEQMFHIVKTEIDHLENRLSRFIPDSPIAELNELKKNIWKTVPEDVWDVLTIAFDFYQMSNGAFDITATPLFNLWKVIDAPSDEEIQNAKLISGFDKVEFDFETKKIRFKEDFIQFDLGALGKGIALDTLKPILHKHGIKKGILSFGESSILAIGTHPNGQNWPLGIRNNYRIHEFVHVFSAKNSTVSTSGSILSSDEGIVEKRNQIISPASGEAIQDNKTVSVKSDSATVGEFLSTTWLILSENDRLILSEKFKNIEVLEVEYDNKEYRTKLTIL